MKLILASNSPRRQAMIKELGFDYEIRLQDIDESFGTDILITEIPLMLAKRKAAAFIPTLQVGEVVLTADTVVICEGQILNKPADSQEAEQMLSLLSGKKHTVITAFCLTSSQKQVCKADSTDVYFRNLSIEEIRHYIQLYKPFDKAGSYGVQEWIGMTGIIRIDGSYFTVVGLPIHLVYESLKEFGF
jgi:septum formation protein